ncbi:RING-type domain-containing protein [Pseudoscourfieldia marina]
MPRTNHRKSSGKDSNDARSLLLAAAALQDHKAHKYSLPDRASLSDPRVRRKHSSLQASLRSQQLDDDAGEGDASGSGSMVTQYSATLAHGHAPMSLAQRMGLADRPAPALTHEVWLDVLKKAYDRGLLTHPAKCAVCRETFKDEPQAVTSCGHAFHLKCLRSFEAFQRRGQSLADASGTIACPLCRTAHYERVTVCVGASYWRRVCATKVQAAWRGHAARLRFVRDVLAKRPPPAQGDVRGGQLRQFAWLAAVVGREGAAIRKELKDADREVDDLMSELDAGAEASRRAMEELERRLGLAQTPNRAVSEEHRTQPSARRSPDLHRRRIDDDDDDDDDNNNNNNRVDVDGGDLSFGHGFTWLGGRGIRAFRPSAQASSTSAPSLPPPHPSMDSTVAPHIADVDWEYVMSEAERRARETGGLECPICMASLSVGISTSSTEPLAWLSCTHVMHVACLDTCESFARAKSERSRRAQDVDGVSKDPDLKCCVCRVAYARRDM